MNDYPHRNYQNLPKIGPVYSSKDEKQRVIAEEILNHKIVPELKLKINMNIPGLEKKKTISALNPETFRFSRRWSSFGKEGWKYLYTMHNIVRVMPPLGGAALFFYAVMDRTQQVYYAKEHLNQEYETCYLKMQSYPGHYADKISLMA